MTDDVPQLQVPQLTGSVLSGRYEVLGKLGVGGMASVYEGRRVGLRNRVAIKVLKPELCEDPSNVKRFLREARAASVIEHENIVEIIDFGSTETMPVYFVMEFLEGLDIKQLIKQEGQIPWARAHSILLQVVGALGAAHQKGIVHRDVKPANIFVVRRPNGDDWVKVLDFGIAKVVEEGLGGITRGLTMTNGLLGTVAFMAPEQARGGKIDARTDIYALGVVMYQMLTGQVPFRGTNPFMVLERHVNEPPRPPRELNPSIPPEAEAIVLRCLAKQPDYRFGSMAELSEVLKMMSTQRLPGGEAQHITQTQRALYAEPLSPPAASQTAFPTAATVPPEIAAQQPVGHPQSAGQQVITAGYESAVAAPPAPAQATEPVGGGATVSSALPSPASSGQASTTGRTQMLSHVMVGKRPPRKSPKAAFFGIGVGVGIAAACALTYMAMRPSVTTPEPAFVPSQQAPAAAPLEPGQGATAPAPVAMPPVHADLKPLPEKPSKAAQQPNPELVDPSPTPAVVPAAERPAPTTAKKPRRGRKGRDRPTAANASAPNEPKPEASPEEKPDPDLHPDLKNPYGL